MVAFFSKSRPVMLSVVPSDSSDVGHVLPDVCMVFCSVENSKQIHR